MRMEYVLFAGSCSISGIIRISWYKASVIICIITKHRDSHL